MDNNELDINPIYDELHKQGFKYSSTETFWNYILLYPSKDWYNFHSDEYQKEREKELLKYTWMTEQEIIDFARMSQEEKDQIKYTVRYNKLKRELEELEGKIN